MVSFVQLLLPIFAAAVLVFVASSLIHMVFKWHQPDYRKLANEDDVRPVIRAGAPSPGQYFIPYCSHHKDIESPAMQQKFVEGPVAMLVVRPSGVPSMGGPLGGWFAMNVVVATIAAYLACATLAKGTSFPDVARLVGIVTFLAYGGGGVSQAIWMGKPWGSAVKELLDAFIYAVLSGLAFAWLWPN